ncbi:MAG: isoprenylcysteine carboxylmethyltransferase family protein [Bryobacteraceae bacterium]
MTEDLLKAAAFVSYLAALVVLALAALLGIAKGPKAAGGISFQGAMGTFLQVAAAGVITRSMGSGALHPAAWELIGMLVLAPASAWLFVWAQVPAARSTGGLVTDGAYAWVRHPMYLAFLGMLLATGLAVSARGSLLAAVAIYLFGTELRIAVEEAGLENYADYQQRTRWRYLPSLR